MAHSPWNRTNYFIAKQYLLERRSQTVLAILGVVFGVSTFIVLLSFMTGVNKFLDDAVFKGNPDLMISAGQSTAEKNSSRLSIVPLEGVKELQEFLGNQGNVEATSLQLITPGILLGNGKQIPVQAHGIIPDQENQMVDLNKRILEGEGFGSLMEEDGVLLGVSLAKQLKTSVGENLRLVLPNGRFAELRVLGIFSFGISTIDNIRAYVNQNSISSYLGKEKLISHLHIKLIDRDDLGLIHPLAQFRTDIEIQDWKENNKTIVVGNKVRDVLTWSVSLALLLVAGFGIFNILNSTVIHKKKDIAVLKTMGYRTRDISVIFLIKSLVIGTIGAFLGGLIGYAVARLISHTPLDTTDFIIVETYPVNFSIWFYLAGISFGIITAGIAGYWPSKKASKLNPAFVIRDI